ncbi:UTP--glucose-1-phosphate uridylyltransferase GalU [Halobacillus sp. BAB-2008]|uniref:UTP--glucose-1-phosphate uridylyltransferase GalU n=1 Tax=Halobacillus sp. BAB-2008 TaxID=1246484 RepID=UPI0002A5035C|nr:UTP--glucose-1-phosphate uridylyltransferase GalU [Halobacillus sp. BAB-2008]ELK48572.1 UTP-glucose-1-phosphate uridylyltransferase [Halobacillus sp. BAB-2008]
MKEIKKAIIPAAGLGTRFLPATKALPKEMLPIVDKPTIQYIVEEAVASGIEDILIVTGKGKRAIEDHFDYAFELEDNLVQKEKYEMLRAVREISDMVDIHYIRQKEPKGLGHAVWCARKFIGNEPFAVLLGDDIVQGNRPCLSQLIDQYKQTGSSVIGVQSVEEEETSRYGIIDPLPLGDRLSRVRHLVEKPKEQPPSNLAIMGRYILTPEIFDFLSREKLGAGGEIQLTDAIQDLTTIQDVYAYRFEGERFDVGEKLGFILTNLHFALKNESLKESVLDEMQKLMERHRILT